MLAPRLRTRAVPARCSFGQSPPPTADFGTTARRATGKDERGGPEVVASGDRRRSYERPVNCTLAGAVPKLAQAGGGHPSGVERREPQRNASSSNGASRGRNLEGEENPREDRVWSFGKLELDITDSRREQDLEVEGEPSGIGVSRNWKRNRERECGGAGPTARG